MMSLRRDGATEMSSGVEGPTSPSTWLGTGWSVSGRTHIASGGADDEGPLVNVVDDYEFFVSS